jgi:hypothetical protein
MTLATINWGSVAEWVSGIGSIFAAVVALYLARASQRIRLRGYCGLRTVLQQGTEPQEILSISVTNIGTRSTIVNNISIQVGTFKKRFGVITMVKDRYSVGIPFPLPDGQEGHWGIPLDEQKSWIRELCESLITKPSDVASLRFRVHTSHGAHLVLRPEKALQTEMLAAYNAKGG